MFVFANPLGNQELDRQATLISADRVNEQLQLVYRITRTGIEGNPREFFAYRRPSDIPAGWEVEGLADPFPQPATRVTRTQPRGKFRLPVEVS